MRSYVVKNRGSKRQLIQLKILANKLERVEPNFYSSFRCFLLKSGSFIFALLDKIGLNKIILLLISPIKEVLLELTFLYKASIFFLNFV